ncbi:hypothetical protein C7G41_19040 [Bradyrhizobium sp. MOS002]|nr:hypothetical protein C7G41_19040 [Bradyrhizobium sp. MOS002]
MAHRLLILRCHAPRKRGIQYAAAHRFNHCCHGVLDRPVKPGDDTVVVATAHAFTTLDFPTRSFNLARHDKHAFLHPRRR